MKNIVWLASYPKSGNTWFRIFLSNYLKNESSPISLDKIGLDSIASNSIDFEDIIGINPFELTADEVDLYRPEVYRVISENAKKEKKFCYKKTHDAYSVNANNDPIFESNISKCVIYFIRNPLDVCVSYANHNGSNIEQILKFILNENAQVFSKRSGQLRQQLLSWKSHIKSWHSQSVIPIHTVRYEDMLENSLSTFGNIITFMGLEYDELRIKKAIVNSDFKLLQQMEFEDGFNEKPQNCNSFFRKGQIGNYRENLSEIQIQRIVEYNYETMNEFGYIDSDGKLTI